MLLTESKIIIIKKCQKKKKGLINYSHDISNKQPKQYIYRVRSLWLDRFSLNPFEYLLPLFCFGYIL